jgi:hypothetical protein
VNPGNELLRAAGNPEISPIEDKLRWLGDRAHDVLLVGADPLPDSDSSWHPPAGVLGQSLHDFDDPTSEDIAGWSWDEGQWFRCRMCQRICVFNTIMSFTGYPCGHYDGDGHMLRYADLCENM